MKLSQHCPLPRTHNDSARGLALESTRSARRDPAALAQDRREPADLARDRRDAPRQALVSAGADALASPLPAVGRKRPRSESSAPAGAPYDEVHDASGQVRAPYAEVWPLLESQRPKRRAQMLKEGRRCFKGDNALSPVPRILTKSEASLLQRGVTLRAEAIRMFLEDHYSGARKYRAIIPEKAIQQIIARSHEQGLDGRLPASQIAFPYGPDVMRASDGRFYVIEDNPGFIGGPGDLIKARKTLFKINPRLRTVLHPVDEPEQYYAALVENARAHAIPRNGRVVLLMHGPYEDHEDNRFERIMRKNGVEVVRTHRGDARLVATPEGAFLEHPSEDGPPLRERVGYIFIHGEHKDLDSGDPALQPAFLFEVATEALEDEELKRRARARVEAALVPDVATGTLDVERLRDTLSTLGLLKKKLLARSTVLEGLTECIVREKVAVDYAPGIDFLGDKSFKGYVDDLVRFYLGEEPLLPSIPVTRFTRSATDERLDPAILHRLLGGKSYKAHVFKVVDGRGGKGVYIGPQMTTADVAELRARIAADPGNFIAEPFTALSVLDEHIVDLRLLAQVSPKAVVVSPTPWGRGVPVGGDGKVNISQHGKEFAVVVVPG